MMVGAAVTSAGRDLAPTLPDVSGAPVTLLAVCWAGYCPAGPCRTAAADMVGAPMTWARGYYAVAHPDATGTPVLPLTVRWTVTRSTGPGAPPGLGGEGKCPTVDLRAAASHDDLLDESLTVVDGAPPSPSL